MEREMAISHHPRWFTLPYKVTDRKSKRQARIGALPGMPNQLRKVDDQTIVSRRIGGDRRVALLRRAVGSSEVSAVLQYFALIPGILRNQ